MSDLFGLISLDSSIEMVGLLLVMTLSDIRLACQRVGGNSCTTVVRIPLADEGLSDQMPPY